MLSYLFKTHNLTCILHPDPKLDFFFPINHLLFCRDLLQDSRELSGKNREQSKVAPPINLLIFFSSHSFVFDVSLACSSAPCKPPSVPRQSSLIVFGSEEPSSWTIALVRYRCIEISFLTYLCSRFNVEHFGVKRCKCSFAMPAASANFNKRTRRVAFCKQELDGSRAQQWCLNHWKFFTFRCDCVGFGRSGLFDRKEKGNIRRNIYHFLCLDKK